MPGTARSRSLKVIMFVTVTGLLLAVAAFAIARPSAAATGAADEPPVETGSGSARYKVISTPESVSRANLAVARLMADSLGAAMLGDTHLSKTMVEDAAGSRVGGGELHRETEFDSNLLMPRAPFLAYLNAWGWGTPEGVYRLDATTGSLVWPIGKYIGGAPLDPAVVAADRDRLAGVYQSVLTATGMAADYEINELASSSVVTSYADGEGVTITAALLPPRSSTEDTGSLVVMMSGDWAIESVYVVTDDDDFYQDVVRGTF